MKTKDSNLSVGQENCQQAEVKNLDDLVFDERNQKLWCLLLKELLQQKCNTCTDYFSSGNFAGYDYPFYCF